MLVDEESKEKINKLSLFCLDQIWGGECELCTIGKDNIVFKELNKDESNKIITNIKAEQEKLEEIDKQLLPEGEQDRIKSYLDSSHMNLKNYMVTYDSKKGLFHLRDENEEMEEGEFSIMSKKKYYSSTKDIYTDGSVLTEVLSFMEKADKNGQLFFTDHHSQEVDEKQTQELKNEILNKIKTVYEKNDVEIYTPKPLLTNEQMAAARQELENQYSSTPQSTEVPEPPQPKPETPVPEKPETKSEKPQQKKEFKLEEFFNERDDTEENDGKKYRKQIIIQDTVTKELKTYSFESCCYNSSQITEEEAEHILSQLKENERLLVKKRNVTKDRKSIENIGFEFSYKRGESESFSPFIRQGDFYAIEKKGDVYSYEQISNKDLKPTISQYNKKIFNQLEGIINLEYNSDDEDPEYNMFLNTQDKKIYIHQGKRRSNEVQFIPTEVGEDDEELRGGFGQEEEESTILKTALKGIVLACDSRLWRPSKELDIIEIGCNITIKDSTNEFIVQPYELKKDGRTREFTGYEEYSKIFMEAAKPIVELCQLQNFDKRDNQESRTVDMESVEEYKQEICNTVDEIIKDYVVANARNVKIDVKTYKFYDNDIQDGIVGNKCRNVLGLIKENVNKVIKDKEQLEKIKNEVNNLNQFVNSLKECKNQEEYRENIAKIILYIQDSKVLSKMPFIKEEIDTGLMRTRYDYFLEEVRKEKEIIEAEAERKRREEEESKRREEEESKRREEEESKRREEEERKRREEEERKRKEEEERKRREEEERKRREEEERKRREEEERKRREEEERKRKEEEERKRKTTVERISLVFEYGASEIVSDGVQYIAENRYGNSKTAVGSNSYIKINYSSSSPEVSIIFMDFTDSPLSENSGKESGQMYNITKKDGKYIYGDNVEITDSENIKKLDEILLDANRDLFIIKSNDQTYIKNDKKVEIPYGQYCIQFTSNGGCLVTNTKNNSNLSMDDINNYPVIKYFTEHNDYNSVVDCLTEKGCKVEEPKTIEYNTIKLSLDDLDSSIPEPPSPPSPPEPLLPPSPPLPSETLETPEIPLNSKIKLNIDLSDILGDDYELTSCIYDTEQNKVKLSCEGKVPDDAASILIDCTLNMGASEEVKGFIEECADAGFKEFIEKNGNVQEGIYEEIKSKYTKINQTLEYINEINTALRNDEIKIESTQKDDMMSDTTVFKIDNENEGKESIKEIKLIYDKSNNSCVEITDDLGYTYSYQGNLADQSKIELVIRKEDGEQTDATTIIDNDIIKQIKQLQTELFAKEITKDIGDKRVIRDREGKYIEIPYKYNEDGKEENYRIKFFKDGTPTQLLQAGNDGKETPVPEGSAIYNNPLIANFMQSDYTDVDTFVIRSNIKTRNSKLSVSIPSVPGVPETPDTTQPETPKPQSFDPQGVIDSLLNTLLNNSGIIQDIDNSNGTVEYNNGTTFTLDANNHKLTYKNASVNSGEDTPTYTFDLIEIEGKLQLRIQDDDRTFKNGIFETMDSKSIEKFKILERQICNDAILSQSDNLPINIDDEVKVEFDNYTITFDVNGNGSPTLEQNKRGLDKYTGDNIILKKFIELNDAPSILQSTEERKEQQFVQLINNNNYTQISCDITEIPTVEEVGEIQNYQTEIEKVGTIPELTQLKNQIQAVLSDRDEQSQQTTENINKVDENLGQINTALTQVEEQIVLTQNQLREIEGLDQRHMDEPVSSDDEEIEDEDETRIKKELETQREEARQLQEEIIRLSTMLNDKDKSLESNEENIIKYGEGKSKIEATIDNKKQQIVKNDEEINKINEELKNAEQKEVKEKTERDELDKILNNTASEIETLGNERQKLDEQYQTDISKINEEIEALKNLVNDDRSNPLSQGSDKKDIHEVDKTGITVEFINDTVQIKLNKEAYNDAKKWDKVRKVCLDQIQEKENNGIKIKELSFYDKQSKTQINYKLQDETYSFSNMFTPQKLFYGFDQELYSRSQGTKLAKNTKNLKKRMKQCPTEFLDIMNSCDAFINNEAKDRIKVDSDKDVIHNTDTAITKDYSVQLQSHEEQKKQIQEEYQQKSLEIQRQIALKKQQWKNYNDNRNNADSERKKAEKTKSDLKNKQQELTEQNEQLENEIKEQTNQLSKININIDTFAKVKEALQKEKELDIEQQSTVQKHLTKLQTEIQTKEKEIQEAREKRKED